MDQLAIEVPPSDTRGALISDDGVHRYNLWRRWGDGLFLGYCMMNPSTADADLDDQTIRRCSYFARREGFGGIYVVNLYAFRATDQNDLWRQRVAYRLGPDNDQHIAAAIQNDRIGQFIAAWGVLPDIGRGRARDVRDMFTVAGRDLWCHGLTQKGWPKHPARLGNSTPIVPFPNPLTLVNRA